MLIFLIILVFAVICYIEVPDLVKKKYWRELIVFFVFLIPGLVLTIMLSLDMYIPNPNRGIEFIVARVLSIF